MLNNQPIFGAQSTQPQQTLGQQQPAHLHLQRAQLQRAAAALSAPAPPHRITANARHEPLGLLNIENRQFLEVRQGYTPIMVPTHLLPTVRTVLSQHLPQYIRANNPQGQSPPQSPQPTPSLYLSLNPPPSTPAVPAPTNEFPLSPLASLVQSSMSLAENQSALQKQNGTPFAHNHSLSLSQLPTAGSSALDSSTPMSSFDDFTLPASSSSLLPFPPPSAKASTFALTSSPHASSLVDVDDLLPLKKPAKPARATRGAKTTKAAKPASAPAALTKTVKSTKAAPSKVTKAAKTTKAARTPPVRSEKPAKTQRLGRQTKLSARRQPSLPLAAEDDEYGEDGDLGLNDIDIDDAGEEVEDVVEGGVNSEDDDEKAKSHLRKPANAFILYRRVKNAELRREQPGISVEVASSVIGKCWREESSSVRHEFQEMAKREREQYFAKKKRLLAKEKLKKMEREELAITPVSRTLSRARRLPSTSSSASGLASQLMVSATHEQASRSADVSSQVHSPASATLPRDIPLAMPLARQSRSFTNPLNLDLDSHRLLGTPSMNNSPLVSGLGTTSLTPALGGLDTGLNLGLSRSVLDSYPTDTGLLGNSVAQDLSQQVASGMDQLKAVYSQAFSSAPLTSLALQPVASTASILDSTPATATTTAAPSDWQLGQPMQQGDWDYISSLLQGNSH